MRRWWVIIGLLAWTLAIIPFVPSASAQGAGATGQKLDSIRRYMEKGQGLYVSGQYEQAAAEFEAGYTKHPYSAFLFNAGVCYQKLNDAPKALDRFREYLKVDPNAPDADKVQERIAALEAALASRPDEGDAGVPEEGDAGVPVDAGEAVEAGPEKPPVLVSSDGDDAMRSLVVIETEPPGAPVRLYARTSPKAPAFKAGADNPQWKEVFAGRSDAEVALAVGHYQIVVERFRDFRLSETSIDVLPGHVHHFKANLSQGAFMAFLRVSANVRGAYVYLDDRAKKRPEWGTTPYGALVVSGEHEVLVEAPGFQPLLTKVQVVHGEQKELEVNLKRVDYGFIRVDSNAPDIRVMVDEKPVGVWRSGEQPLEVKLAAGKHRLTIESDGRKTFEGMVTVPKGQVLPVHAKLIPKYPRGAAWTQAIIGAAVLGASIYVGMESDRLYDELESDRKAGVLVAGDERIMRGRLYAIGADAGFAVGGVLGLLSVYNFVKDPLPDSSIKEGRAVEFPDPKKQPPSARRALRRQVAERKLSPLAEPATWHLRPVVGENSGFLFFGGSF